MIKLLRFICLTLVLSSSFLTAETETSLEFRTAAFLPTSNLFKKIYSDCGVSYQLEASTHDMYRYVDLWSNFDWFSKKGKTDGFSDPTRVNIGTFSLGIKFPYHLSKNLKPYVGIGASFAGIWLKNNTPCTDENVSKVSVGGILKSGIYYYFLKNVFIDAFVDYSYQPVHFDNNIDIGGVKAGLGLGVQF